MSTSKSLDQLRTLSLKLPQLLATADETYQHLELEASKLQRAGVLHASAYWRNGRYLCLVYPSGTQARRHKYIGSNLVKIRESQAAMKRAIEHDSLISQLSQLEGIAAYCVQHLAEVTQALSDFERHERALLVQRSGKAKGDASLQIPASGTSTKRTTPMY